MHVTGNYFIFALSLILFLNKISFFCIQVKALVKSECKLRNTLQRAHFINRFNHFNFDSNLWDLILEPKWVYTSLALKSFTVWMTKLIHMCPFYPFSTVTKVNAVHFHGIGFVNNTKRLRVTINIHFDVDYKGIFTWFSFYIQRVEFRLTLILSNFFLFENGFQRNRSKDFQLLWI